MSVRLNPYISFDGDAREAMEFYKSVFGGKLDLNTFKEFQSSHGSSDDDKIMHAQLEGDHDIVFMAADTPSGMEFHPGTNMSMSLSGDDEELLKGYFEQLSAGGRVVIPLDKAPWGDHFGMFTDKFGVAWMVNIAGKK